MAKFETKAIHTGLAHREKTGSVIPPIYATSTFEYGNKEGFDYTRSGNPCFRNLENTLASLEDASHATVFSSGVAAITAVVSSLKSGDLILAEENIYGCTFRLFEQVLKKYGIEIVYADLSKKENYSLVVDKKPQIVWIESPTNPLLKLIDIKALAEVCRTEKTDLVVDNTFASPYLQKPLELGATLSLSSTTKYINGHSDCLGGVVCTNDNEWSDKLEFAVKALGLNPSPFDAWLVARGAKTLSLRMDKHSSNALALAEHLKELKSVQWVRYPFLSDDPQHELAKSQMSAGSGLIVCSFDLSKDETLKRLQSLKYFTLAESLGGVESLVCHPATMTHASVPKKTREAVGITDSVVRFSVGVEAAEDLISDLSEVF